jgi:hypothetical protein
MDLDGLGLSRRRAIFFFSAMSIEPALVRRADKWQVVKAGPDQRNRR